MRLKILIVGLSLVIISGCAAKAPNITIMSIGDCERGIVTETNLEYVNGVWPSAQITDVLISGGCYQDRFIKKR